MGHWHIGYYEGDYCIKAIGLENQKGTRDVYFNELDDNHVRKLLGSGYEIDKVFGTKKRLGHYARPNFSYLFSGTTSTNPQMLLFGMIILIAGLNAGKIGLDRWIIPFINKQILKKEEQDNLPQSA